MAHELTHIANRDVMVMTLAVLLRDDRRLHRPVRLLLRRRHGHGGDDEDGLSFIAVFFISIAVYAVSFLLMQTLSRYREFAADRGAAIITGRPSALASRADEDLVAACTRSRRRTCARRRSWRPSTSSRPARGKAPRRALRDAPADGEAHRRPAAPRGSAPVRTVTAPEPVADAVLEDLRRRLRDTRAAALPSGAGWDRGTDADYLAELVRYWAEEYDWRPHEARIRALPWVATSGARAVLEPRRRRRPLRSSCCCTAGRTPCCASSVCCPSSTTSTSSSRRCPATRSRPRRRACRRRRWRTSSPALMAELGFERYSVSGGDIGSGVGAALAVRHPERVAALHLTDVPLRARARSRPGDALRARARAT